MATRHRPIGSDGLEQGGEHLGNDYSRSVSRERNNEEGENRTILPRKKGKQEKETKQGTNKSKTGRRKS